jgi:hypothetical protein
MAKTPTKKKAPAKKKAPVKRTKVSITLMDVSTVDKAEHLHVKCINPDSEKIFEALGITEERLIELESYARKAFIATDKLTAAMVEASTFCKHANELAYVMYVISDMRSQMNHPIVRILGGGGMGGPKE